MKRFFTSTGNLNNLILHELDHNGLSLNVQIKARDFGLKDYQLENIIRHTNNGRLSVLNSSGRWTSTVAQTASPVNTDNIEDTKSPVVVEPAWTTMKAVGINPDDLQPLQTGTLFDKFVSTEEGFLPGTNIMCVGAPGTGKTTLLMEIISKLHLNGKKTLFISAEMNQLDMARYMKRFPNWAEVPILFLNDFDNPKAQLEATLNQGWDLVLTDSYTEVNDLVKDETGWPKMKVEKWFLDLLNNHNMKGNQAQTATCFITILQQNKGGQFVGSNKLKHMTTSMLHLEWDGKENHGERYMYFSKNRCGQVGIRLYFDVNNQGVSIDDTRFLRHQNLTQTIKQEKEKLKEEADLFDKIFGTGFEVTEEAEVKELESA